MVEIKISAHDRGFDSWNLEARNSETAVLMPYPISIELPNLFFFGQTSTKEPINSGVMSLDSRLRENQILSKTYPTSKPLPKFTRTEPYRNVRGLTSESTTFSAQNG